MCECDKPCNSWSAMIVLIRSKIVPGQEKSYGLVHVGVRYWWESCIHNFVYLLSTNKGVHLESEEMSISFMVKW